MREFVQKAFQIVGISISWHGERGTVDEIGVDDATGSTLVVIDPAYFRPTEVDVLLGDASKAKQVLGWESNIPFEELVREMVMEDLKIVAGEEIDTAAPRP